MSKQARVSIDNGNTYYTALEVCELAGDHGERLDYLMPAVVAAMDDDVREAVHLDLTGVCGDREFLARYLEAAEQDLVIG